MGRKTFKGSLRASGGLAAALVAALLAAPAAATQVYGTLGNFDAVNDTGKVAHGFEIDLEDITSADVTDTFGGAGRGFPSTVERYGAPTITDYKTPDGRPAVAIVYRGTFSNGAWNVGTPSGVYSTPGESCWTGGGSGYGAGTPCDHFGVGTTKNASKTSYAWLTETAPNSPTLDNTLANLPAPVQIVMPPAPPPPGAPAPQPIVLGVVRSLDPLPGFDFGVPEWVKIFTTQYEHPVALEDLVGGGLAPQDPAEVEIEWQLLQTEAGNPNSGKLENGGAAANDGAESVLRRYEFYKYSGGYKGQNGQVTFTYDGTEVVDDIAVLSGPGANVGDFIGAQNLGVNLNGVYVPNGVPEPSTWLLLVMGFAGLGGMAARRRLRAA